MKKIVILGCENTHADAFLSLIKNKEEFSNVEVTGVYSIDPAASERMSTKFNVPIMNDYAEAVGKVDGIVITARHGDSHFTFAKPYIESGIPMFIDKPITITEADAREFKELLIKNNVKVCGGSSLKQDEYILKLKAEVESSEGGPTTGGFVRAPYQPESIHGGFYFYAQHLVEMVCEIFGRFPISVTAKKNGKNINVLFHYEEFDCVGMFADKGGIYYALRMSETTATSYNISATSDWFYKEFNEFHDLLNGGEQKMSYEEFFNSVFIMNAIDRSVQSRQEEFINK